MPVIDDVLWDALLEEHILDSTTERLQYQREINRLLHGNDEQCLLTLIFWASSVPNKLRRCCSSRFAPIQCSSTALHTSEGS